jgi:hypothetical protein
MWAIKTHRLGLILLQAWRGVGSCAVAGAVSGGGAGDADGSTDASGSVRFSNTAVSATLHVDHSSTVR